MMKQLKFRIWDKQFNKFLYQLPEQHHLDWERFDIQQFTGLKDKNGVLIYEGDIITGESEYSPRFPAPIIWYHTGWYAGVVEENGKTRNITSLEVINNLEIIGDIYQDSHLLENK